MSITHDPERLGRSGTEEHAYLLRRAEDHRRLAEKSDESGARTIHLRLEGLYREQAALVLMVFPS